MQLREYTFSTFRVFFPPFFRERESEIIKISRNEPEAASDLDGASNPDIKENNDLQKRWVRNRRKRW